MARHVLNFKKQFAALVESGEKTQTIRAPRKRPICPGDPLRLYTGMRRPECRLLGDAICTSVTPIRIDYGVGTPRVIFLNERRLYSTEAIVFARADGFDRLSHMLDFFEREHGLPFVGVLIKWRKI